MKAQSLNRWTSREAPRRCFENEESNRYLYAAEMDGKERKKDERSRDLAGQCHKESRGDGIWWVGGQGSVHYFSLLFPLVCRH